MGWFIGGFMLGGIAGIILAAILSAGKDKNE